jgi:hypothetical protein
MAKRRRKMSAKQLKYFGKKRTRTVYVKTKTKRRKKTMAKRRYKGYASRGIGGVKGMLPCIIGGVADSYLDPMLPIDGVGATAVGMFMHNSTLKDIGLYKVGFSLGNILPLPGRGATSNGGLL